MSAKPLVLLTGATGFVGAHILALLLENGYAVLAPVRSTTKSTFLEKKYPAQISSGDLSFVTIPNLQVPNALDPVLQQERKVTYICHVASPFFLNSTDPINDLVTPAMESTKNVLNSAITYGKALKKVIILSSFAAVQNPFDEPRAGYIYTEKDWNPIDMEQAGSNGILGYIASKTFAERAAWDLYQTSKEAKKEISWDLLTFCPPMIYGAPLHEINVSKGIGGLNTSLTALLGGLTTPPSVATPSLPHWIDVRDVALAHVKALTLPAGISERFLLCSGAAYYEDGLGRLRAKNTKGLAGEGEKCDSSKHYSIDCGKAEKMLEMEWKKFEECVENVWDWAQSVGFVGQ